MKLNVLQMALLEQLLLSEISPSRLPHSPVCASASSSGVPQLKEDSFSNSLKLNYFDSLREMQ